MAHKTSELELIKLSKRYGSVTAVDALDLHIPSGSYCCLIGPSMTPWVGANPSVGVRHE
jgi:ABC-type branched-subunit amino acid transport system ATPase component